MDQKIEIKEEPVWLEGAASASFDNYELLSEETHLKEESKSELLGIEQTQVDTCEVFPDNGNHEKTAEQISMSNSHFKGHCLKVLRKMDNFELLLEETHLKEEIKSELLETEQTDVDTCESLADVKDEIFVEEHTVGQLDPCFKEDNNVASIGACTSHPLESCESCCNGSELKCSFQSDNGERPYCCNVSNQHLTSSMQSPCNGTHSLEPNIERNSFKYHGEVISTHTWKPASCCDEHGKLNSGKSKLREYSHICEVCGNNFSQKSVLKRHMLTHSGQRPHVCPLCKKCFAEKSTLKSHMLTHTGERPHACNECGSKFSRKSNLKCHMLTHSAVRRHVCLDCGCKFSHKSALERHVMTHSDQLPYCCNECGRTFSRKSYLKYHMLAHYEEQPYVCNKCTKSFIYKSSLDRHMSTHSAYHRRVCKVCNNVFSNASTLKSHMLSHARDFIHICDTCGKTFFRKTHLERHVLTHSKERPYCCHECGKTFSRKTYLIYHMPKHCEEQRYVCAKCSKSFVHKSSLHRHKLTHDAPS